MKAIKKRALGGLSLALSLLLLGACAPGDKKTESGQPSAEVSAETSGQPSAETSAASQSERPPESETSARKPRPEESGSSDPRHDAGSKNGQQEEQPMDVVFYRGDHVAGKAIHEHFFVAHTAGEAKSWLVDIEGEYDVYRKLDGKSFADELTSRGDDFYQTHKLAILLEETSSGSVRFGFKGIEIEKDKTVILLTRTRPEMGTTDMATWHAAIPLPKDAPEPVVLKWE